MTKLKRPDENLYFNHPIDQNVAYELMSMSLEEKEYESYVKLTEWYIAWEGKCYVSFSGGKDSTVLAYLTAQCFMENEWFKTPLVLCFFDTGLEYPEIRDFILLDKSKHIIFFPKRHWSTLRSFCLKGVTTSSLPFLFAENAFRGHCCQNRDCSCLFFIFVRRPFLHNVAATVINLKWSV